jgi:fructose-1,6-bisphosphatase/inositol monophosphatase family enzyme
MSLLPVEECCFRSFRAGNNFSIRSNSDDDWEWWIHFVLDSLLQSGRIVRGLKTDSLSTTTNFKTDSSPVTEQEKEIELVLKQRMENLCPDAVLMGEEIGGKLPNHGIAVAIDPVDGTWAFLNRMQTSSIVIAVFRNGEIFLGAVLIPATGEIGYAVDDHPSRLIQFDLFGESDRAVGLPLERVSGTGEILVNIHPSRKCGPYVERLIASWSNGDIGMVRMEGGSPSAALLESAKGSFVYVNLWSKKPAEAFDLAAAVKIFRNSGGEVIDVRGQPINANTHRGPFVSAIDEADGRKVLEMLDFDI